MDKQQCLHCRFWLPVKDGAGQCRRFPPNIPQNLNCPDTGLPIFMQPTTFKADWCGEWKQATPLPEVQGDFDPSSLSVRARKALNKLGIVNISQLEGVTEDQILGLKATGWTTVLELRCFAAERGLSIPNLRKMRLY